MSASKSLSDFLPEVLPHVPGCFDAMAKNSVLNAAIAFCERTGAYRQELDPMQIDAGVSDYELEVPTDTITYKILRVGVDGEPIDPKSPKQLDIENAGWQAKTGTPFAYYVKDIRRTLRLVYTPESSIVNGLVIEVALKPVKGATKFEVAFFEEYYDDIAAGALAELLSMSAKPWTNSRKAAEALDRFNKAIANHSVEAAKAQANAPLRTVPYYDIG
jgi:hypothetical protein